MEPVDSAPWVKCDDRPVDGAIFEPRATAGCPGGARHEYGNVLIEVGNSCRGWRQRLDVLGLRFLEDVDHVLGGVFEDGHDRAVADGCIGAEEHYFALTTAVSHSPRYFDLDDNCENGQGYSGYWECSLLK